MSSSNGDTAMLTFRLDPDLAARLTAIARSTGQSKSQIVRDAILARMPELEGLASNGTGTVAAVIEYDGE
jgi:predicted transcriptional regulator